MKNDSIAMLEAVRELAAAVSARSGEMESARRLPADLLAQLTTAGCFRMFVPKSHGGLELDVPSSMEIIEKLASADGSTCCAVGIGIAQRAVDEIVSLAGTNKRRLYAQSSVAKSRLFQYRLGHAATSLRAARNLLRSEAEQVWASAVTERPATPADRSRVMGAVTWSAHTAAAVVDACYTVGSGTSLYESSPLQLCLHDIHTLTQHAAVAETWLERSGSSILGRDSGFAV